MKDHIRQSIILVNKYPGYILLIGILGVTFNFGAFAVISLIGFFVSLIFEVILLGKLSNLSINKPTSQNITIFKENWLNYLIITIIVGAPLLILGQVKNIFSFDMLNLLFIKILLTITMATLSLYALPIALHIPEQGDHLAPEYAPCA